MLFTFKDTYNEVLGDVVRPLYGTYTSCSNDNPILKGATIKSNGPIYTKVKTAEVEFGDNIICV